LDGNHSNGEVVGSSSAPYLNSLARDCGLATNYHNITHPSLPNYIAATSGLGGQGLAPFKSDCNPSARCSTDATSIFAQVPSWRACEESMPLGVTARTPATTPLATIRRSTTGRSAAVRGATSRSPTWQAT
jgi:hypothetical protein